jgi:hypothetical protein
MIRRLIKVRYAAHYGLNADIARGSKSAKSRLTHCTRPYFKSKYRNSQDRRLVIRPLVPEQGSRREHAMVLDLPAVVVGRVPILSPQRQP